jgi:hypothetical protein
MIGLLLDPFEIAWMLLKQSKEEEMREDIKRMKTRISTLEHQLETNSDYINSLMGATPEALEATKAGLERKERELEEYMAGVGGKRAERKKERTRGKELERQAFIDRSKKISQQRQQSAQAKDDARVQAEKDAEDAKRQAEEEKHEKERIRQEKRQQYQERKFGKPQEETAIEDPDAPIESVLEEFNRREQAKLGEAKKPPTVRPPRRVAVRRPPPPPEEKEDDDEEDWEKFQREQANIGSYDPFGDD